MKPLKVPERNPETNPSFEAILKNQSENTSPNSPATQKKKGLFSLVFKKSSRKNSVGISAFESEEPQNFIFKNISKDDTATSNTNKSENNGGITPRTLKRSMSSKSMSYSTTPSPVPARRVSATSSTEKPILLSKNPQENENAFEVLMSSQEARKLFHSFLIEAVCDGLCSFIQTFRSIYFHIKEDGRRGGKKKKRNREKFKGNLRDKNKKPNQKTKERRKKKKNLSLYLSGPFLFPLLIPTI